MARARGNYAPRAGSSGEEAREAAREARRKRLAANDRAYRAALRLDDDEPLPRSLGHVMRHGGRPQRFSDPHGGRHSSGTTSAART